MVGRVNKTSMLFPFGKPSSNKVNSVRKSRVFTQTPFLKKLKSLPNQARNIVSKADNSRRSVGPVKNGFCNWTGLSNGVKVKICGMTSLADAQKAVQLGADALGFVFYPRSKRFISPSKAKKIMQRLPRSIKKVGVFVNEKKYRVKNIVKFCGLDVLQFHGEESVGYCNDFKDYQVIKAFRIRDLGSLKDISDYSVEAYMLDSYEKDAFGGTGKTFNWDLLKKIKRLRKPLILSGGLTYSNVRRAIKKLKPYAVDVSTGVESSPGRKNHMLIKRFIQAAKNTKVK